MMIYQWSYETINQVHIELSTYCNAACPMCPRHVQGPDLSALPIVRPELVLESITYENFIKWFPEEFAKKINLWALCGTHGDPMMNKDILKIIRYICETGGSFSANTNGGMRDKDFWTELAQITQIKHPLRPLAKRMIVFSIDGLWDTNHLYRRNVPFEKAIDNAKVFIDAGGSATWDYLIFKHNEHQIEEAEKLSKSMGFKYFVAKKALGFFHPPDSLVERTVRNKDGSFAYVLEPPSDKFNRINNEGSSIVIKKSNTEQFSFDVVEFMKKREPRNNHVDTKKKYLTLLNSNYQPTETEQSTKVVCKSHASSHEIYVDAHGNVFPCCYVGTTFWANYNVASNIQLNSEISNFGLEKISLKHNTLPEIMSSGYLQHTFEDKWGKAWPAGMLYCNETCGEKSAIDKVFTHDKDNRPEGLKLHLTTARKRKLMEQDVIK